jgi:hypothetical protein
MFSDGERQHPPLKYDSWHDRPQVNFAQVKKTYVFELLWRVLLGPGYIYGADRDRPTGTRLWAVRTACMRSATPGCGSPPGQIFQDLSLSSMSNSERVTGPGNGLVSLAVVLLLCVLTTAGIWTLHKRRFVDPLETVVPQGSTHQAPQPVSAH